jgi:hypothetical protein
MTIDSSWLVRFKEELPSCFTPCLPQRRVGAVFIDGQIRLMGSSHRDSIGWDEFISRQFWQPVERAFAVSDVVILAFDNYAYVPRAKSMTQNKRVRTVPPLPFTEQMELPSRVPTGEMWARSVANRLFKTRVVDLALLRMPDLLSRLPNKRLILDYATPVSYQCIDGEVRREVMTELDALGEADVKFTRYVKFGDLLIESIDGDTIPISLMYHERCLRYSGSAPRIFVRRLRIRTAEESKGAREYEIVSVTGLYEGLRDVVAQATGRVPLPAQVGFEGRMLVALIALTGTDFSRNLPLLSGAFVYENLTRVWMALAGAYNVETEQLREDATVDGLLALLYNLRYPNHTDAVRSGYNGVAAKIQGSKLSERTKRLMPTRERMIATVRNVNWVLQYWRCEEVEDPIQERYGFQTLSNGKVAYTDA